MSTIRENGLFVMYDIANKCKLYYNNLERTSMNKTMRGIAYHFIIKFGGFIENEDISKVKLCNFSKLERYTGQKNPSVHKSLYKLSNCVFMQCVDEKSNPSDPKILAKPLVSVRRIPINLHKKSQKKTAYRFMLNYPHKYYMNFLNPAINKNSLLKEIYEKQINKFFDERGGFKEYIKTI